jgi:hypothetical protein
MSLLALLLVALPQNAPAAPPKVECTDLAYRALDFWIGDWDVFDTASGTRIARSRVEKSADGCIVAETYEQNVDRGGTKSDYRGTSNTMLTRRDGLWRQSYTDNKGRVATLAGTITGNVMLLTQTFGRERSRMTLALQPDGSLRQRAVASSDFGKTFSSTPSFDFTYRRRAAP